MAVDYGQLARDLVQEHFPKFGTFGRDVTYQSAAANSYDPDTGDVIKGITTDYPLYVIIMGFSFTKNQSDDRQFDDVAIFGVDRKCLFPAADLPVSPKIGDFVISEGTTYRVMAVNKDPKPAHWAIHLRPEELS